MEVPAVSAANCVFQSAGREWGNLKCMHSQNCIIGYAAYMHSSRTKRLVCLIGSFHLNRVSLCISSLKAEHTIEQRTPWSKQLCLTEGCVSRLTIQYWPALWKPSQQNRGVFSKRVAYVICGSFVTLFWTPFILQLCHHGPAIRHEIVAWVPFTNYRYVSKISNGRKTVSWHFYTGASTKVSAKSVPGDPQPWGFLWLLVNSLDAFNLCMAMGRLQHSKYLAARRFWENGRPLG
jgi:hypothetical protein